MLESLHQADRFNAKPALTDILFARNLLKPSLCTKEMALNKFWELVSGALALQPEVFQQINTVPRGEIVALVVVLAAGLSQTIGQCIVLFVNRVKPVRFVFSLLVATILFACTYVFWAVSIWLVSHFGFRADPDLLTIGRTLGLSYTPQIFGFLVALPHIGIPISVLLSIWSLLAIVIGFNALTGFGIWTTLACTGLGWVMLQLLQRTVGRPVTTLGQALMNLVAGTRLVSDREELAELVMSAWQPTSRLANLPGWIQSVSQPVTKPSKIPTPVKLLAIALVAFSIVISVSAALQNNVGIWYATLSTTYRVIMDLISVSLLAIGFAIVLTPLEALSWWAGWYGDEKIEYHGSLVEEISDRTNIVRYVLYLDGINQGTFAYLAEVDNFLNELAEALPDNILILKGIMPYSVINRPLTENRPLAFLWRAIDAAVLSNPNHPLGVFINIRNVVAVAVSADPRYGPLQNQGLAQVLYDCLLSYGYSCDRKTPITLIGFSGGAQMAIGVVPFLQRATGAPIEVISISGVISGNTGEMDVEQLYHLVGKQDVVEKLGPLLFPDRWALYFLSYWNRAKRRGRISFLSLGSVGHNGAGGPFWAETRLPDGRTHLQHTLELAIGILLKDWTLTGIDPDSGDQISNYERYKQATFKQPSHYLIQPLTPGVRASDNPSPYQPIATWMGRLILPSQADRPIPRKVLFEVYHADETHRDLVGQTVWLGWSDTPDVQNYVQLVTEDVHFIDQVKVSERQGNVHPVRLNHWQTVDPLESLAGARPEDDVVVMLPEPVVVGDGEMRGWGEAAAGEDAERIQSPISNLQSPISNLQSLSHALHHP
ncbi:MAG: hypothetical protein HC866_23875 [Leptolyngbyaceae cyanobacterium RU_5_1]|nr:hypothetical protein [Leptolyngbyaceae cyanobacterium RU_5_1]